MVAFNTDYEFDKESVFGGYAAPDSRVNFQALYTSVEASYRGLESFRTLNRNLIREYAGPAYGESEQRRKYLNMTAQLVDAYTMLLAANRPKAEVTTRYTALQPYARHYSVGLNNLIAEIGLEYTIRRWVLDAFFTVGVIKVHQKNAGEIQFEKNLWMDPGTPFASNVSLDNFVYDMGARTWGEVRWAGDMYRVPMEDIKQGVEIGMYDPECLEYLVATSKYHVSEGRVDEFSKGNNLDLDDYMPMVDLADIWIARERKIYTFIVDKRSTFCIKKKPIAVMDWDDPEHGPYHLLGFADVPDNIMPIGPAVHMDELDRLINTLFRKQARQAKRQKNHVIYSPQGAQTAQRMQRHPDGGMFEGNPDQFREVNEGGVHPLNQQFLINLMDFYNRMSGNVESMLGLGAQSDTVGQEQLIHDASNRKVGAMQSRVLDSTRRLLKSLAFMLWQDEFKEIAGQMTVEGTDWTVEANWRPGDREGNFLDYNFDVNVYSMVYRPPAQQAETMMGILDRLAPYSQMLMAQGGSPDFARITADLSELLDAPKIKNWFVFNMPAMSEEGEPGTSVKPQNTKRTYERISRSTGPTGPGKYAQMQQQWASAANSMGGSSGQVS